jgi:hypothetical protein
VQRGFNFPITFGAWKKSLVCCLDFRVIAPQLSALGCVARYKHKDYQMADCGNDSVAGSLEYDSAGWKPPLAPKSPEMAQAVREFETNRSVATEAAMWEQVRRDELRDRRRDEAIFIPVLLADIAVIYFFWNYGVKKAAPNKPPEPT